MRPARPQQNRVGSRSRCNPGAPNRGQERAAGKESDDNTRVLSSPRVALCLVGAKRKVQKARQTQQTFRNVQPKPILVPPDET